MHSVENPAAEPEIIVVNPGMDPDALADSVIAQRDQRPFYPEREDWQVRGLCHGLDAGEVVIFFAQPTRKGLTSEQRAHERRATDAAKRMCDACIVEEVCLQDALDRREPAGIRGGKTSHERRKILQGRSAA